MTPEDIIAAARLAIGTPFAHQGRTVGAKLDCAGLLAHVCQSLGKPVADQDGYSRRPSGGLLEAALDAHHPRRQQRRLATEQGRAGAVVDDQRPTGHPPLRRLGQGQQGGEGAPLGPVRGGGRVWRHGLSVASPLSWGRLPRPNARSSGDHRSAAL